MAKKQIISRLFNSIRDFEAYLTGGTIQPAFKGKESSIKGTFSFTGTKSYKEANDLMLKGDSEGAAQIEKMGVADTRKSLKKYRNKRQIYSSPVGFAPNVPAYICGAPNSMIACRMKKVPQKTLSLCYTMNASCCIDKDDLMRASANLLSAVLMLEAAGTRISLYMGSVGSEEKQLGGFYVKLKDAGQKLDLLRTVYPLTNPSFLRRHHFRFLEVTPEIDNSWVWGYGIPGEQEECETIANSLHLKSDKILTFYAIRDLTPQQIIDLIYSTK